MANPKFRVVIPHNPDDLLKLLKLVLAKHSDEGGNSPLNPLPMAEVESAVLTTDAQQVLVEQLRKDSEMATQTRDNLLGIAKGQLSSTKGTVLFHLKSARDILLGVYKGREKELGAWGFIVNHSSKTGVDDTEKSK